MKQNNLLSVQTTSAQLKALDINQKADHDFDEMNAM
jgi:hypothetical protein